LGSLKEKNKMRFELMLRFQWNEEHMMNFIGISWTQSYDPKAFYNKKLWVGAPCVVLLVNKNLYGLKFALCYTCWFCP
jgi:hypothetical protein